MGLQGSGISKGQQKGSRRTVEGQQKGSRRAVRGSIKWWDMGNTRNGIVRQVYDTMMSNSV
jgi:hypothetical protein